MTKSSDFLFHLRFDTVDGLYLQENDVEHESYVLLEDLTAHLEAHNAAITRDDVLELAMSGGHARRNYSIYDKFVEITPILDHIEKLQR